MEELYYFGGREKHWKKVRNVYTRVKFPKVLLRAIVQDVLCRASPESIKRRHNISSQTLDEIFTLYNITGGTFNRKSVPILGTKNVPYYENEEEMIVPEYKFEDLSLTEKEFYEQRNKAEMC